LLELVAKILIYKYCWWRIPFGAKAYHNSPENGGRSLLHKKCSGKGTEIKANVITSLLEKCLKTPVAGALWYWFFEPVPRKWYQRLEPLVPGKLTVT